MENENIYKEQIVNEVLRQYGIRPDYFEIKGKVRKVYFRDQVYALKETGVRDGNHFIQFPRYLFEKGYYRFIPIYPTKNGQYFVLRDKRLFYLMPWLDNKSLNRTDKIPKMFRELAKLHSLTSKEVSASKNEIKEHYEQVKLNWKRQAEFLDQWMEICEQRWYMSPFEWEFVQYYHDIRKSFDYIDQNIEQWFYIMERQEKIRTVLSHGKFSPDHFIFDDKGYGYFINFEKSQIASPFRDLLPFIVNTLKTFPKQSSECLEWLFTYLKFYPLKKEEKLLFKCYLAHPGYIIRTLEGYTQARSANHELKYTKRLQNDYWLFKNIEFVVMRLEEDDKQEENVQQQIQ